MNSSRTWKSGERCQVAGTYRCQQCRLEERDTRRDMAVGQVFPMCETCSQKDATWRLMRAAAGASPRGA
jgi:hypothetical protein